MNPSGKPDNNLVNIDPAQSGTPDNPTMLFFDVLDASVRDANGAPIYTGALKVTNFCHDFIIHVSRILGGSETHVDINHCAQRIKVICGEFHNVSSEYISSIKGGSVDCTITGPVTGIAPSKGVHHIDGNWSDQSSTITSGTRLEYALPDGLPVRYDQLNSAGVSGINLQRRWFIPTRIGIAMVWFVWAQLKRLRLA